LVTLEINPEMTLSWEFVEDYIRFTVGCKVDGYCSFGWGNKDMFPTDAVGIMRNGSSAAVGDYWMPDYNAPRSDVSSGGHDDYVLESGSFSNNLL
jgi:hypothetical protein